MLDAYKQLTANQFEAAFCTLNACIDKCPDAAWDGPVANLAFCQVAFHALFFTDLYLGRDVETFRRQEFHRDNAKFFGDYEEMEDRPPVSRYDKPSIKEYLQHCREKAGGVVASETAESLGGASGFDWLPFARAELHVYNIRHLLHHAAQLSLRLRIDSGVDVPWVKSGWREV